jgi:hypothetical protein
MMQSADHGLGNDATELFDWSTDRRVLSQRQVRASFNIVGGITNCSRTKLSIAALSQTLPERLIEPRLPSSRALPRLAPPCDREAWNSGEFHLG